MIFAETFKLKVRFCPVEENHFHVDIISIFVQEIFQKDRHGLEGDVATDNNVPGKNLFSSKDCFQFDFTFSPLLRCRIPSTCFSVQAAPESQEGHRQRASVKMCHRNGFRGTSETIYQSNGKKHELEDTSNFGGAGYVSISDWKRAL